jgi:predicted GTPase
MMVLKPSNQLIVDRLTCQSDKAFIPKFINLSKRIMKRKVIIMGAAGRDFHNFNVFFRDNKDYKVVAFTAEQIPGIAGRNYPRVLAGRSYPKGIPIYPEKQLPDLIKKHKVDLVVLAYSDLFDEDVMHKASIVMANGADFKLMGPNSTMLKSKRPVIAITAVRTGAGKSPTSRRVVAILKNLGKKVVVVRHPMGYGPLKKEIVERYETQEDLKKYATTIEEREEYEPHLEQGTIVYAGVDYEKVLRQAEKEAKVIVWDGGNNDFPFIKPDLHICVADCRRPGHELLFYPGEINFRIADIIILNKIATSNPVDIQHVYQNAKKINPKAIVIKAAMPHKVDKPELIKGRRVLVIEDGPTLTHGGMSIGAGTIAAKSLGAFIINPRNEAVGSIRELYAKYPNLGSVLPAMGYSKKQLRELEDTINKVNCDAIVIGTPFDLRKLLSVNKPIARVRYELQEIGKPNLEDVIKKFIK